MSESVSEPVSVIDINAMTMLSDRPPVCPATCSGQTGVVTPG